MRYISSFLARLIYYYKAFYWCWHGDTWMDTPVSQLFLLHFASCWHSGRKQSGLANGSRQLCISCKCIWKHSPKVRPVDGWLVNVRLLAWKIQNSIGVLCLCIDLFTCSEGCMIDAHLLHIIASGFLHMCIIWVGPEVLLFTLCCMFACHLVVSTFYLSHSAVSEWF